ncbi:hypothetical protein BBK82_13060 [Lentzea guizhouensis]|uniref:Fido domain-containing protein n=1 Tax=Lentzea guizhouensis TaxID=1586287 RepID=A0A1B2HGN4_9PSEU|nr:Fic family protein [Lentzea guizhouensis]ANZ36864.1 hypothetical protein BBK82_13060 [Lentzea guizhouensis]
MTTTQVRRHEETHPWLTFDLALKRFSPKTWLLLGEATSKMDHIANVNLRPFVARELHKLFLTRGVQGTVAIEGNTLSEAEVRQAVDGELELPPSQEYLHREVNNVLAGCHAIADRAAEEGRQPITTDWICWLNKQVLAGLELKDDVVAGEVRSHNVGVFLYRGAPHQDCLHLLDRLCDWLNSDDWAAEKEFRDCMTIVKAIVAHLYIAWIHPFGDGNGRTARLLEFQILIEGGVPSPAAHLLSNHFNRTRDQYYRELDKTSRQGPPYPVETFVHYAVQGLVDGLRDQLRMIRAQQTLVTWQNYVHEELPGTTETDVRRRELILTLPSGEWTPRADIPTLSVELARMYATKTDKTITRDINALEELELLVKGGRRGVRANIELIRAFLPLRLQPND